jgi:hypothetical protein
VELFRPTNSKTIVTDRDAGNLEGPRMAALFAICGFFYLLIYAVESPIRYILYLGGKDSLILLRDGLIIAPLIVLFAVQASRLRVHPAIISFATLMAFHGVVLMGTIGSVLGVAYGIKILINLLFGYFAASLITSPGRRMMKIFIALWCLTLIGVLLDKFLVTFPWVGIKTIVGDLTVDVSKDWQIQDTLSRRVAGFARSSIGVAMLVPLLAIVLMGQIRNGLLRAFVGIVSLGAVFLTTQKGSLIAFAPVAVIMTLRSRQERFWLRLWCLTAATLVIALPLVTNDLHLGHGTGVFSTESLYLRIADTWPHAWDWISRHQMMVFGVGLGGIGGPQRLYAPDNFNPADNLFILLYAYFGIFGLLYMAAACWLALRPVTGSERRANTAIALLAFAFGYGTVLSTLEDQVAPLFVGAALGVLWRETRTAFTARRVTVPLARPLRAAST